MKHIEKNMECIAFKEDEFDLIFATVYRLQRYMYSIGAFMNNFSLLSNNLELLSIRLICLGRFQPRHYEQSNFSFEFHVRERV